MQLHFAKAYTQFLKTSALYNLRYQPVAERQDQSTGEMWLKRFLTEETNDQGQTYLTLQSPFGITLDREKEDGLNVERLNDKLETVETLNTLGERGAVGERLQAFPERLVAGDKICLFKRAIFDRSGELVGGATRIVELFAPTTAASYWLTISDNLYGKESVDYAGGSSMLFEIESAESMTLQYVTFSGPDDSSLLTFKVIDRQALQ
jgi:hypothetical protein